MAGRSVERRVKGNQVALPDQCAEIDEISALACGTGRIAGNDAESPCGGILADQFADMPRPDYAQTLLRRVPAALYGKMVQDGTHPLQHTPCIASGRRRDADAAFPTIVQIDMVEPDGRRGDEPHAGTVEQCRIAAGAGADDQCIGIVYVAWSDRPSRKIDRFGVRFKHPAQIRYGFVDDDFHFPRALSLRQR